MRTWSFLLDSHSTKTQLDLGFRRCTRNMRGIHPQMDVRAESRLGQRSAAAQTWKKRPSAAANLSLVKRSNHFTIHAAESKTPNFGSRTPSFEPGTGDRSCSTHSRGTVVNRGPRLGPDEAPRR